MRGSCTVEQRKWEQLLSVLTGSRGAVLQLCLVQDARTSALSLVLLAMIWMMDLCLPQPAPSFCVPASSANKEMLKPAWQGDFSCSTTGKGFPSWFELLETDRKFMMCCREVAVSFVYDD